MTAANIPFSEWAQMVLPKTWAKGVAEGEAKGVAEGKAEGKADSLLAILGARSIAVPDDVRDRITTCSDIEQLDAWIVRAATALKVEELFD